ncbi:hypothetical protein ACO0SA_002377 [Hanseniaspora valbyensis]
MHGGLSKKDLLPRYSQKKFLSNMPRSNFFVKVLNYLNNTVLENRFVKKNKLLRKLKKKNYLVHALVLFLLLTIILYKFVFISNISPLSVSSSSSALSSVSSSDISGKIDAKKGGNALVTENTVLKNYEDDDMKDSKLNMEKAKELLLNQLYAKEQAEKAKEAKLKGTNNGNDIKALKQSDEAKNNKNSEDSNLDPPFKKTQDELDKQKLKEDVAKQIGNPKADSSK